MYRHARFVKQEQRFNDYYNPNKKKENFIYPSAAQAKVDPARPTVLLHTGVGSISPPRPPKVKPEIGKFTFDIRLRSGDCSGRSVCRGLRTGYWHSRTSLDMHVRTILSPNKRFASTRSCSHFAS